MSKLKVAVVYGGPSKEHEVSVMSGKAILNALSNQYQAKDVLITKDGQWQFGDELLNQNNALDKLAEEEYFVLLGLHGTFGEDGTIQALLEERKIRFSGSGSHASKLAFNKHDTSLLFSDAGFHVPKEIVVNEGFNKSEDEFLKNFQLPVIVKPVTQGSSVGISKVTNGKDLKPALNKAFKEGTKVLIQEYIKGVEVSCGVIEDELGELKALPPTELIPLKSDFFDYEAKYTSGATNEVTPPDLPEEIIERIKQAGLAAHRVVYCSGYSRTDMIIKNDRIYYIEINTLPGMTEGSIMPQQAKADNLSLEQLLDLIIQAGLRKGV